MFCEQGLNPFPGKPWILHVCSTSLLKTLCETSDFSFSHSVFYPLWDWRTFCHLQQFWYGHLQTLSFRKSLKLVVWERVMHLQKYCLLSACTVDIGLHGLIHFAIFDILQLKRPVQPMTHDLQLNVPSMLGKAYYLKYVTSLWRRFRARHSRHFRNNILYLRYTSFVIKWLNLGIMLPT